jgi:replication factor C small subunit
MLEDFLWVEKYRPKTVSDTILTDELKKTFQQFVDQKNIPNLILSGTAGVGKRLWLKPCVKSLDVTTSLSTVR